MSDEQLESRFAGMERHLDKRADAIEERLDKRVAASEQRILAEMATRIETSSTSGRRTQRRECEAMRRLCRRSTSNSKRRGSASRSWKAARVRKTCEKIIATDKNR